MQLGEALERQRDMLLKSLQESIRIPSVQAPAQEGAPYGPNVRRCLDHALETARSLGFTVEDMDHQTGWCEYGEGEEMVAVLGHLDVVPAGDNWSFDPFGGEIQDGKIFGRGAMDDKGPTIAAIYALNAVRETGLPLRRRIRVLFGTNEETGSADLKYYLAHGGELPVMGFTPDGEYPVINGEKGIINVSFEKTYSQSGELRLEHLHGGVAANVVPAFAEAELSCSPELAAQLLERSSKQVCFTLCERGVRVQSFGVSAHGGTPEQGENAIGRLLQALSILPLSLDLRSTLSFLAEKIGMESDGRSLGIALRDAVSGGLTLNLGTIEGDATALHLEINYRYPVTKRIEDCDPILQQTFADAGFTLLSRIHKASLYIPEDSQLVGTLLKVYRDATGDETGPKSIGGGTYAKSIPNIVAFGPIFPGDEVREHKPDEFIEIDKLMKNAQIIASAMYQLAK